MQQLSGQDASFIYAEQAHAPTHVMSVGIYDPSTAPGGAVTFKGILKHISERLDGARAFRQKMVRVPNDLDHPWWVEDSHFDLEYHVRHIALPKPGDWRQFCIQLGRLHARPLDLSKPQWEMYIIEGLDDVEGLPKGSFGVAIKVHHAAVDGKSGVEMTTAIHTQSPDEQPPPPPARAWRGEPTPNPMELLARASANAWRVPFRAAEVAARMVPGIIKAARGPRNTALTTRAPHTPFNTPVSPHRVIDARFFKFADLKPMRGLVPGATVNDVALSVVGGALREYLQAHGELPDLPLHAMTPVSVRTESEKKDLGNQVSAMMVSLATDVADPVDRLAAVCESTNASKELTKAIGARNLTELSQFAPGALVGLGTRMVGQFARRGMADVINTTVTNVPGPREPLYFAGAELIRSFGSGPIMDGMGLINIVGSYRDQFMLSFTGDRAQMPDPERYADAIETSFYALSKAASKA